MPSATDAIAITEAAKGADPLTQSLILVLGLIILVISVAKPLMALVKQRRDEKREATVDDVVADANNTVYKRLQEQIRENSEDIKVLIAEKNKWQDESIKRQEEIIQLRGRIGTLEMCEASMNRMKDKLDEKDGIIEELRSAIAERDARIISMMEELMKTNNRLHDLEIRLTRDEQSIPGVASPA